LGTLTTPCYECLEGMCKGFIAGERNSSMKYWKPCAEYSKVVDANRCFYAKKAELYDQLETCVNNAISQRILTNDLERIADLLEESADELKVLDACGGSGNVALKLLRRGISVTVADVSEELLNILRKKCTEFGYVPRIFCKEIGAFFQEETDEYDLIVFSSALHHLQDVKSILRMAYSRLNRGGFVFTIFDPTSQNENSWIGRRVARMDYLLFKIRKQPKDILPAFRRKILKARRRGSENHLKNRACSSSLDEDLGALAEYHAVSGINDIELVEYLRGVGYEVLWHERYANARHGAFCWMLRTLGDKTHFKLLLRK